LKIRLAKKSTAQEKAHLLTLLIFIFNGVRDLKIAVRSTSRKTKDCKRAFPFPLFPSAKKE